MKISIATLVLLTTTLLAEAEISLLTGPIINPGNGHSYYLTSPDTWTATETFANSVGAHLATIRNSQEDSWIYSSFMNRPGVPDTLWIGISDARQEGIWEWASGESANYRNWATGEPNNLANIENYGRYFQTYHPYAGMWNDAPNEALANGVIEVIPEPATALFFAGTAGLVLRRRLPHSAVAARSASPRDCIR